MWDKHIQDLRIEFERLIPHKCHWWTLVDAEICISIDGHIMDIKLPIPKILGNPAWHEEEKYRERNEAEIARVREMWNQLIVAMKEKLKKIDEGSSAVETEFKDGILFENGKYGLNYKGKVKIWK